MKNKVRYLVEGIIFILGIVSLLIVLLNVFTTSKMLLIVLPVIIYGLYSSNNFLLEKSNLLEKQLEAKLIELNESITDLLHKLRLTNERSFYIKIKQYKNNVSSFQKVLKKSKLFKFLGFKFFIYWYIMLRLSKVISDYKITYKDFKSYYNQYKNYEKQKYNQKNTYKEKDLQEKHKWIKFFNLKEDFSSNELKKAFKEKAKKHHPDVDKDNPNATEIFKKINTGYQLLLSSVQQ